MAASRIEQLAERPDLLPVVADWIYREWWTSVAGASADEVGDLLRCHLIPDRMPLTLVASLGDHPIGTATLLEHDIGTERWPDLSPWLAALYVVPEFRHRGTGATLVGAIVAKAIALGVGTLYLVTVDGEGFYSRLGWQVLSREEGKVVMAKPTLRSE